MDMLFIMLQARPAQQANPLMSFLPLILIFVIMWFFMIRPQQKKQKQLQNYRNSIAVGAEVITVGGIYGTVRAIDEASNILTIEVANGVRIRVDRNCINPVGADMAAK